MQPGIAGRLSFVGEWPANVGEVAVAVYREPPAALIDFFNINGWDTAVELGAESYNYFVPLDGEGVYQWIIVAWRAEGQVWNLTSLLGCYLTPVEVEPGQITPDIDIEVNFAVLDDETDPSIALCERALPADLLAELGR